MHTHDPLAERMLSADLSRLSWTKGLEESAIEAIIQVAEHVHVAENEVIHRAGDPLKSVYFVIRGRINVSIIDLFGRIVLERSLVRGSCFGLFSVVQEEDACVDIKAAEPASLLKLNFDQLHDLTTKYRQFQINLYRLASEQVRRIVNVDRAREKPSAVGIIHQSPSTRPLTRKLVSRLIEIEETPCIASDDPNWEPIDKSAFKLLIDKRGDLIGVEESRQQLEAWSDMGRIFVDATVDHKLEDLERLFQFVDTVLWCVRPEDAQPAAELLEKMHQRVAGWRDKLCLVWQLDSKDYVAPSLPSVESIVDRSFKISFDTPQTNQGRNLNHGLERLIHHLRGIRIGIALGGGAARGMAHLGVLKALEQNGIYIDMLAGTSAGAMTGTLYTYGMDVDYSVRCFENDLRLPRTFRHLPGGGYWYLLYKYRRGQFDPMLRKYLGDAKLNQLSIPTFTVTVDLVSGGPVVREDRDAVRSILESINLPGLSSPLINEREALVDGGLVNNIPADVLVEKGCNFVIASSVTASLEKMFSGIHSEHGQVKRRKPSTLQVLLRGHLVQSHNMNAVGVQPADFVIAPDVTEFDLSEFERTDEMSKIGEQTALNTIQQIKSMLSKLDDKLFPMD
jgi:NTE family protein